MKSFADILQDKLGKGGAKKATTSSEPAVPFVHASVHSSVYSSADSTAAELLFNELFRQNISRFEISRKASSRNPYQNSRHYSSAKSKLNKLVTQIEFTEEPSEVNSTESITDNTTINSAQAPRPAWRKFSEKQILAAKFFEQFKESLDEATTLIEIKSAFRRLALRLHPDQHVNQSADIELKHWNERFRELHAHYQELIK